MQKTENRATHSNPPPSAGFRASLDCFARSRPRRAIALACAALLAACGGGGGGGGDDTNPTITSFEATSGGVVSRSRVTISGVAQDDQRLDRVEIIVGDRSSPVMLSADGRFSADIELRPGLNDYAVVATDAAGNVTRRTGSVYLGHRVAAGGSHSGAIVDGVLYAWGRNNLGQAGLGTTTTLASDATTHPVRPTRIEMPVRFAALSFNQNYSIALDEGGRLWSWGEDTDGQLGRGDTGRATCTGTTPNCRLDIGRIDGLDQVVAVSAGYSHVLALRADGSVWSFGANASGQLGDGTTVRRSTPAQVQWATADAAVVGRIVKVSASAASSYALDDKGQVWGWGRDQYANLGRGSVAAAGAVQATPVRVPLPDGVRIVELANGRDHVLARAADGSVYGWGLNATSQVGFNGVNYKGTSEAWPTPVTSPRLLPSTGAAAPALAIYANGNTSYLLRSGGKLSPWGMYGATAGGGATAYSNLDEPDAAPLSSLSGVQDLAVGALHQVALDSDGKLYSWGWSFEGSLGGGATTANTWMYNVPVALTLP